MKNILLVFLFAFTVHTAGAQLWKPPFPIDSTTQQVAYQGVVQVPAQTQAQLYSKARAWFATAFKSANDVLQLEDAATAKLMGKGNTLVNGRRFSFSIAVDSKDGRYRYQITDIQQQTAATVSSFGGTVVRIPASSIPLLQLTTGPKNFTKKGEPKPGVEQTAKAIDDAFKQIATSLQQAMLSKEKDW